MVRRSRRLAGLPPVFDEEEVEVVENSSNSFEVKGGLLYTDVPRVEYVWLIVTLLFFLLPLYLFLGNS